VKEIFGVRKLRGRKVSRPRQNLRTRKTRVKTLSRGRGGKRGPEKTYPIGQGCSGKKRKGRGKEPAGRSGGSGREISGGGGSSLRKKAVPGTKEKKGVRLEGGG